MWATLEGQEEIRAVVTTTRGEQWEHCRRRRGGTRGQDPQGVTRYPVPGGKRWGGWNRPGSENGEDNGGAAPGGGAASVKRIRRRRNKAHGRGGQGGVAGQGGSKGSGQELTGARRGQKRGVNIKKEVVDGNKSEQILFL